MAGSSRGSPPEFTGDIEDLYRRAIEVSGAVPYYLDYATDEYRFVGEGIETLTGLPVSEFTYERWKSLLREVRLLGELEGLKLEEALQRARSPEGLNWRADYRLLTPAGEEKWIANAAIQVRDSEGRVIGSLGVLQDITERKAAEKHAVDKELYYRSILNGLAEDILIIDREYRIADINDGFMRTTGHKRSEIIGRYCFEVSHGYNEPCMEKGEECPLARVFETGKPANCHHIHRRTDGSHVHVDLLLSPLIDDRGNVTHIIEAIRDVTDLHHAQREVRKREELYRKAIEVASAVPYYQDYETDGYPFVGEGIQDLLGCAPEEFEKVWDELIVETIPAGELEGLSLEEAQTLCREKGIEWQCEFRVRTRWGEERWLMNSAIPVRDDRGNIIGSLGILRDITERKSLIRSLMESEERFRRIFEHASEGIAMVDEEETYLWANPAHCRQLGVEPGMLTGRNLREFVDDETWELLRNMTERRLRGEASRYTFKMRRVDGEVRTFFISAIPVFKADGRYEGVQGILLDITELERFQAETNLLRSAIEQSPSSVMITNTEGVIEYVNPAFERTSGYDRNEVLGQTPRFLKSGVHDEAFYRTLWNTITSGKVWTGTFTNKRKDGALYDEETVIAPVFGPRGEVTHFVAVKRDLTREKTLEEEVRQAQKLEVIGQLAGGVAHDFNNILQGMFGFIQFLTQSLPSDSGSMQYVEEIRKGAERAASLTRQLLAFSRRQIIQPQDVNLNNLIENLLKMIRRLIGENIELDYIPGHNLGYVRVDPGQMDQVILNLCVNARDAMPEGGRLTIETENVLINGAYIASHPWAKPGHYVLLTVSDTGCGMDEKTLSRIFEPFFTTKEVDKGSGLGLSTVYGIVQQHEGMIRAYSELGKGSVFKVYLPTVERRAVDVPSRVEPPAKGGSETILVAEDDPMVQKVVQRLLENSGYRVLVTNDGIEALQVFEEHREAIDLVFLDVVMPNLDGRKAFEEMKKKKPGLKALFSSGYSPNSAHTQHVLDANLDLIQKPYDPDTLRRKVRELLDRE